MRAAMGLSRRAVLRAGMAGLVGGVGAAALAACGERQIVEKVVTQTVEVVKVVTKEVPVEKIVTTEVQKVVTKEVVVEKIVEAAKERAPGLDVNLITRPVAIGGAKWNPVKGGEISYFTFGNPNSLDPQKWTGRAPEATSPMYETLYTWGPDYAIQPHLAAELPKVADDKLSWVVPLRKDVKFHDGTAFNADAVVFNFQRFLDQAATRGSVVRDVSSIKSAEKVDEFSVRFQTNGPQPLFAKFLAGQNPVMVSPDAVKKLGKDFERNPVGTGPYKFVSWKDNVEITYARFDDYKWGPPFAQNKGPGLADTAKIKMLSTDNAARAQAFEAGEIDILLQFTFPDVQRIAANKAFHVIGFLNTGTGQYHPMNTRKWPLTDINVRKALIHGLDRRTVSVRANGGLAPLLVSNMLAPGTLGHNPEATKLYDWNVAKANKILDDAGYPKKKEDSLRYDKDGKRLELIFPNTPNPVAELFKLDVERNLGIFVDVPNIEFATFAEGSDKGNYHLGWVGVGGPDGDVLYDRFHTSFYGKPGRAWSFFEYSGEAGKANPDAKIDKLLDAARGNFDQAARIKNWQAADLYLMENAVAIPLVQELLAWMTNPAKIGGVLFMQGIRTAPYFGDFYSLKK